MDTEDDTFRILKRMEFRDLVKGCILRSAGISGSWIVGNEQFITDSGWTVDELLAKTGQLRADEWSNVIDMVNNFVRR